MQCNVGPRKRTPSSPLLLSRILVVQLKMTIALYPVCTAVQQGPSQSSQSHFLSSFAHRVFLAAVFATSLSSLASLSIEMTTTPDQRENEAGRGVRRRMDQERVSSTSILPGRVDFSTHFDVDRLNRSIWVNKLTRSICM